MIPIPDPIAPNALFIHVRIVIGVILGLSIGKLLQGVAGLAEHPRKAKIWWVHLGWVFWALVSVIGFWWWEYHLNRIGSWTFGQYLFIFFYTACYFLICALLFPEKLGEYQGYEDYFISRRRWFFGIVALTFVLDVGDTYLKGIDYLSGRGTPYIVHTGVSLTACALGSLISDRRFHAALVVDAIAYQLFYFFTYYGTLA